MNRDLTKGNVFKTLVIFTLPYLLASFLQTFYGMADLYIVGQFYEASSISAVAIGSQFMHFITVVIIGLAMGTTVRIGQAVGGKKYDEVSKIIMNAILVFAVLAVLITTTMTLNTKGIVRIMSTPEEAQIYAAQYLKVCLLGIPFIIAYNVVCGIFRGLGDSKSPMYFVAISCVTNIILDYVLVGGCHLGAAGAAYATVIAQGLSFILAILYMRRRDFGFHIAPRLNGINRSTAGAVLTAGVPIALQDGFIQVSFLVITIIANSLGLVPSTAVGIVEKVISFLFMVPSAVLSALSALVALNVGAEDHIRAKRLLQYGLTINIGFGLFCCILCQVVPQGILSLFTKDAEVIASGANYLRSYGTDCIFAGIHFAFSGYFCGYGYSYISFVHNLISVLLVRVPGAYICARIFGSFLLPMGFAAPCGSILSGFICLGFFLHYSRKWIGEKQK